MTRARPRLLAFDLDGTLISDGGTQISPATIDALWALRQSGSRVAVITGRDSLPTQIQDVLTPDAVATNNGGRILVGTELHTEARFDPAELDALLAHGLEGARVIAFTQDTLYVDLPPGQPVAPWLAARQHAPLHQAPREEVLKVGFYHPGVAELRTRLGSSHPQLVATGAQAPYPEFLTVTPTGADKGAALVAIAGALGVELADTWAFGDSDNDVAMLALAGNPVQVGALPLLREYARATVSGPEALAGYLRGLLE